MIAVFVVLQRNRHDDPQSSPEIADIITGQRDHAEALAAELRRQEAERYPNPADRTAYWVEAVNLNPNREGIES